MKKRAILILFFIAIFCYAQNQHAIFQEYKQEKYETIIIVGDTQKTSGWEFWRENNDSVRKLLFPAILEEKPSAIIILGDLIFRGSSKSHWKDFDLNTQCVRDNRITLYPLLGNHNYYGNNTKALKSYFQRFPYLNGQRWYDRKLSNAAFLFLDSNFSQLTQEEIFQQNLWYTKKLREYDNDPSIKHVFVCDHHPPFTNSQVIASREEVKQYFLPAFLSTPKAKVFFSGHCHAYEHFLYENKHFVVSGGGGGPRHRLNTTSSSKYQDIFKGPVIRKFHYCKLILPTARLIMIAYDPEKKTWVQEDEWGL